MRLRRVEDAHALVIVLSQVSVRIQPLSYVLTYIHHTPSDDTWYVLYSNTTTILGNREMIPPQPTPLCCQGIKGVGAPGRTAIEDREEEKLAIFLPAAAKPPGHTTRLIRVVVVAVVVVGENHHVMMTCPIFIK